MRRLLLLPALALFLLGCTERPKAPPLRGTPVYNNSHFGLRFLIPEKWTPVARADRPPSGPGDHLLLRIQAPPGTSRASFEVSVDEHPESGDIEAIVRERSHGSSAAGWELVGAPTPITVGGTPAMRYSLKDKKSTKEVVALRRDKALFLFTLIADSKDAEAREQIRQLIDGVTWTK
jgi:hypothetical protein